MPLNKPRPWVIAHRGAPKEAPENTLKGFALAIHQGANLLEIDVHLSADRQLVVIHDDRVDRTTNSTGRVNQLSLKELSALDAGCWMGPAHCGEKIPTLNQVLDLSAARVGVVIELKQGSNQYAGIERLLVQTIETSQRLDDVIVISGNSAAIQAINKLNPAIMTLDFGHPPIASSTWRNAKPLPMHGKRYLFAKPNAVDPQHIQRLHELGFCVLSSLVKEKTSQSVVEKLLTARVDGIFTDCVLKLKHMLKRLNEIGQTPS